MSVSKLSSRFLLSSINLFNCWNSLVGKIPLVEEEMKAGGIRDIEKNEWKKNRFRRYFMTYLSTRLHCPKSFWQQDARFDRSHIRCRLEPLSVLPHPSQRLRQHPVWLPVRRLLLRRWIHLQQSRQLPDCRRTPTSARKTRSHYSCFYTAGTIRIFI